MEDNNNIPYFLALTLNLPHVGKYQNDHPNRVTSPVPNCGAVQCNINEFALYGHSDMLENYIEAP